MKYLLALALLAGCATTRQYEESLRTWEGKPAAALVQKWGAPTKMVRLADGGKMYLYYRRNKENIRVKKELASEGLSTEALYDCKTEMLANPQDVIVSWKFEGHDCRR